MRKPEELISLIEELQDQRNGDVRPPSTAKAIIYLDEDDDPEDAISLNAEECSAVFNKPENVDRLMEALGYPENASLQLIDLDLSHAVIDSLERKFVTVDEG